MIPDSYTYDYFRTSFQNASERAEELLKDVDQDDFTARPEEGKWSMAEILSHLVQAGNQYLDQIRLAFEQESKPKANEPFNHNFFFKWFTRQVSPQNKRPLPTVNLFEPLEHYEIQEYEVLEAFQELQADFIEFVDEAENEKVDLSRLMARNPILKFIKMPVSACFAITEAHQRRHLEQMKAIKALLENRNSHFKTTE